MISLWDKNKIKIFYNKNISSYNIKRKTFETTDKVVVPNNIDMAVVHQEINTISKQSTSKTVTPYQNDAITKSNYVSLARFEAFYEDYMDFKDHIRDVLNNNLHKAIEPEKETWQEKK